MPKRPDSEASKRIVIVAERNHAPAAAIADALGSGRSLDTWTTIAEAAEALGRGRSVDLLVLVLGETSPREACAPLRAVAKDMPLLIVYLAPPPHAGLRALEAGADDSAAWPVEPAELRLRVDTLLDRGSRWSRCQLEIAKLRRLAAFKDDLVSLIVHDLRNPLAGMLGFLSSLDATTQGAQHRDLREDIDGAMAGALKVEGVLSELLQIRLLEEGALKPRLGPHELRHLIQDAARSLEGVSRERGVTIEVTAAQGETGEVDGKLVSRALENLIANALRYSPRGASVGVAARLVSGELCFEVADAGPGIPDEFKQTIFGKFTSVEAERGQARHGFGLGLYQVKLVVDAHGGRILLRDRPGGGAVFEICLPMPVS